MINKDTGRFGAFQAVIIHQLLRTSPNIPTLTTLRLGNLCPLHYMGFQQKLVGLTNAQIGSLSVTMISNEDSARLVSMSIPAIRHFVQTPLIIMPPFSTSLTNLHLGSARGHFSVLDSMALKELRYPHLKVLSLENIVFDTPSSPQSLYSFIIRHKATLERLCIHSCPLTISDASEMSLKYWSHIWNAFATELSALVDVDVVAPSPSDSYHLLPENVQVESLITPSRVEEDDACLTKFRSMVHSRL